MSPPNFRDAVAESESGRLPDDTLEPPAYDEASVWRQQVVELIAAVGDFVRDVLTQRSGPRQPRSSTDKIHAAERLVPADNRRKVLTHTDDVDFRVASDMTLHVTHVRGRFVPVGRTEIPTLMTSIHISLRSTPPRSRQIWREQLVPPPAIRGKVTAVRVTDDALVQTFGSGERRRLSPPAVSRNYIYWRGAELRFGKLTMTETDLELLEEHDGPRVEDAHSGLQRPSFEEVNAHATA